MLLMAVDLGTSFIKAGVYNEQSECVAIYSEPVRDERPGPGIFIQRGDQLFESAVNCIKNVCGQLGEKVKDIQAIAFTGQMAGFMGVDKDWRDITTWSCSLDSRYIPYAARQMEFLKDDFLTIAGTNSPQMAGKVEWFKNEFPGESKKIVKYLMISGYMIGRLSEMPVDDAVIDQTFIQWTGLADVSKREWSADICKALDMDMDTLPKIVQSDSICGYLSKAIAGKTGLQSGIPLVSGAGDKAAGCLGAAITSPGDMIFEASSYGALSCCVEEYRPDLKDRRLDVIPAPLPGKYYETNYVPGSGITLDWFVNTFVRQEGEKLSKAFERVDAEAGKVKPGCNDMMAIGLLGGSAMPLLSSLRGMWMGFDWSHKQGHFYRALLESFSYDFTLTEKRLEALYPEYDLSTVRIIGGGAKSPLWTQMNADVMGKEFHRLNREDVAMWGAAMLAGSAIGLFPDIVKTAQKHVKVEQVYHPDMKMNETYKKHMDLYKQYTVELTEFFERIKKLGKS
jgi:xylulokinase